MYNHAHPRCHRLLKKTDFQMVFEQVETKVSCKELTLLARRSATNQARIGFIITKKNEKKAVIRNRIRRQAKEVFRLNYTEWAPLDIILLTRGCLAQVSNKDLQQLILRMLKKLSQRSIDSGLVKTPESVRQ